MANNKKMVEDITSMEVDFAKWYTDIVKKAELCDYSSVKGCMIVRPYGYAIWENIQHILDAEFKKTGHQNVAMPLFIPESLLQKEKDHVEGFAPEVAWVTYGGSEELEERLCVRPTSETLFCDHYKNIIKSYRDLPKLYNQWCSVVRWEKTTRPFLRTREFLWQEGHTMHETAQEAIDETEMILNIYADFCEKQLAMPVVRGKKTDSEKFSGAEATYTIEAMMHDGKSLQAGTSHYFGDHFAKAFEIEFQNRENKPQTPHQTSWGVSTRLIGGIIMTHGDDNGLVLPPAIAPIQVVVIPVAQHKEGVIEKAQEVKERLAKQFRTDIDISDNSPGWKFAQYEMKGVPLRLEIGPKDIEQNQVVVLCEEGVSAYMLTGAYGYPSPTITGEIERDIVFVKEVLGVKLAISDHRAPNVTEDELIQIANEKSGFIKAMWCGDAECEAKLKEVAGVSSRCMPFAQEHLSDTCVCCGKPAKSMVIWGKAY